MPRPPKMATCHPERKHHGRGLCSPCYKRLPEFREKNRLAQVKFRRDHPDLKWRANRDYELRKKYGIEPTDYDALLAAQGGLCAICHRPPKKQLLSVDHDHETGRIRGLLCVSCNRALGTLGDSISGLENAIAYLRSPIAVLGFHYGPDAMKGETRAD